MHYCKNQKEKKATGSFFTAIQAMGSESWKSGFYEPVMFRNTSLKITLIKYKLYVTFESVASSGVRV